MFLFRTKTPIRALLAGTTASVLLVVAGCGSTDTEANGENQANEELTTITVAEQGNADLATGAMAHLADQLGYFEDQGLRVDEYVVVTSGGDAISGILSGDVQISHIGADGFVSADQGGDIVGIGANTDASFWTVVANPEITDWSQLEGETIALGSTSDITRAVFDQLAEQAGLDPDADLNYVALGATPQRIAAVQEEQTAATIASYGAAGRVIDDGLTDLGFAPEGTDVPQLMTTEIAASRSWAEDQPEDVAAYLRAIKQATDFAKDPANSDEVAEIIGQINDEPEEYIKQGLEHYYINPSSPDAFFPEDFRHVPGAFDTTVETYRELGLFEGEITEEEYMDYTYADMAMEN